MSTSAFRALVRHPLKFRLFLMTKLPAAWCAGLRVQALSEAACTVTVPYKWFNRNPFGSIYFACLSMAAELSTGALCMQYIYRSRPAVSMLVVAQEGRFFKKATGLIRFTCADGAAIAAAVARAVETGEGQTVTARSSGLNTQNESVAEFSFTWSFKARPA